MIVIRWTRRALTHLGIDPAIGFVLVGYVVLGCVSVLQLLLVVRHLTGSEQGVHFSFLNFFPLQICFDLGLGLVIQQLGSHQRAFLHETPAGVFEGPAQHRTRLAALLRLTVTWYLGVFVAWTAVMVPVGWIFFTFGRGLTDIDWHLAWILTVIGSGGCLVSGGLTKFMSGCGDIAAVARVNTLQLLVSAIGFCAILALGGKLLAFSLSLFCGLIVPAIWLFGIRRRLLADLWRAPVEETPLSWQRDVRPFQWRIALSLISAEVFYILYQVVFTSYGPVTAGRLGVDLTVAFSIQQIGIAWVETRIPVFGRLVAKRNWAELDRVYRHVLIKSTSFVATVLALLIAFNFALNQWDHPTIRAGMNRILDPIPAALLALVVLANHLFSVRAAYLRAHAKEPYLFVAVGQGLVLVATMLAIGRYGSLDAMLGGFLFWVLVLGQGLGGWIFHVKRREWHTPTAEM